MLGDVELWKIIVGTVGTVAVGWFVLVGARHTANTSKAGAEQTSHVNAQESALQAWESLLQPYRDEVATLRAELKDEREDRATQQTRIERRRIEAKADSDEQMAVMRRQIEDLSSQVGEWKRLAKTIARWATTLRDEVLRLGGTVPVTPEELLTLQAIEDAEQNPPHSP